MGKGISTNIASEILNKKEPTALLDLFALYYNYQNDSQAVVIFSWWDKWNIPANYF